MESSEKLEELDQSRLRKASDTTREVSYAVLDVSPKNTTGVLEKFAITINVQLTLQPGQEIPFIPFNGFDKVKEASKLFLYGPSGCGKSRCIYELVKERITDFKEIFVINPRLTTAAKESGRAKLTELFARFSQEDAVIWDNFTWLFVVALLLASVFHASANLSVVFLFVIDRVPFSARNYFCNCKRHYIVFLF
jgi:hypothetical protein